MSAQQAPHAARNRVRMERPIEALVGKIEPSADVHDDGHARPAEERANVTIVARRQRELRVIEADSFGHGIELDRSKGAIGATAEPVGASPFDVSPPEG